MNILHTHRHLYMHIHRYTKVFNLVGVYSSVAYPGLVKKGGVRYVFVIFAHAHTVGRCGFERMDYKSMVLRIVYKPALCSLVRSTSNA